MKKVNEYYIISINMADIIDISDLGESSSSSNFGGGVELLMNNKLQGREKPGNVNIGLDDLDDLEKELNDLGNVQIDESLNFGANVNTNEGRGVSFGDNDNIHLNIHEDDGDVPLGSATSNMNSHKTWDDFGKYNDISGSGATNDIGAQRMSKDEIQKEQYRMIRKLEEFERKSNGKIQLSKKYTMESSFNDVKNEYESIVEDGSRKASVKFQGSCMKMLINGIEFLNNKFDPFDVNLDGWGDKVEDDMNDYDDIFGELYDKYKSRGSIAPELKLMFQLGGSAFMVNLSNKIFKTAAPGMDDIFRQNPELMRSFQNAAVNTMSQNNPGIGNFMSGVAGGPQTRPGSGPGPNQSQRFGPGQGPPAPMPTQGQYAEPPPAHRGGNNPRPDLDAARGTQAREQPRGQNDRERERVPSSRAPGPRYIPPAQQQGTNNSAINLALGDPSDRSERKRPEMRGPSDLGDLLSGIKTKTIDISKTSATQPQMMSEIRGTKDEDNISQMSTDTMSVAANGVKKPRKPRKPKSDKNTVSLDL